MAKTRPFEHLTPESYLHLFIEQAGNMAQGVNCNTLEAFIQQIVLNSSETLEHMYRKGKILQGPLSMEEYGKLLLELKNSIGGKFEIIEQNEKILRLKTTQCPFGSTVESAPALCHMTSSIFGGIAARNYGYAKVELKRRIALGSDHCDICIHRDPTLAEDICGNEYFSDGFKVIAEVRAPSDLQKTIEQRLHTLWLKDHQSPRENLQETPPRLVARSPAMVTLLSSVEIIAPTHVPVLLSGETGVGKEVIAKSIHAMSQRNNAAFVTMNCGSIPAELVETELFGHEAGAYTDAKHTRPGRFEVANGGSLFLDEVDCLSPKAQVSLLRVLQEGCYERVGGRKTQRCDVRVIAATNQNLMQLVETHQFRRDLFYRLNVVPLFIPPLRERPEDLEPLVECLLERFTQRYQAASPKTLTQPAFAALASHHWPGNVRELENILERSYLFTHDHVISNILFDLPPNAHPHQTHDLKAAKRKAADQVERQMLEQALTRFNGQINLVANFLALSSRAVYQKLEYYGIDPHTYRT
ncbi:MAG TPA: AAA family ATPase [Gammaproteobacteria bacterium]|nr:AAA family ATPase [Gammaproteobacteria bacterium]